MNCPKVPFYMNRADDRGAFAGLINEGSWKEVNFVTTKPGEVRGGHFHTHTNELIFLLRGKAEVELQDCNNMNNRQTLVLNAGEGVRIEPYIVHTFNYLEHSEQVALLDTSFNPQDPDLHVLADNN